MYGKLFDVGIGLLTGYEACGLAIEWAEIWIAAAKD